MGRLTLHHLQHHPFLDLCVGSYLPFVSVILPAKWTYSQDPTHSTEKVSDREWDIICSCARLHSMGAVPLDDCLALQTTACFNINTSYYRVPGTTNDFKMGLLFANYCFKKFHI